MSQSNAKETVLMRIEIGMDSRTKKAFEEFKAKCSQTLDALSVIAAKTKQADGGLLRAMEAEAANDASAVECPDDDAVELKQLGQWVFEGCDEKWQSAALNADGRAYRHNYPLALIYNRKGTWVSNCFSKHEVELIEANFDCNHSIMAIQRQSVNDVDYLSDSIPHIDDVLNQPNWLSESIIPITETDLQSIFIKNLSTVLIQRMHSLDRFSEDDYHVGGEKLMPWDIVIGESSFNNKKPNFAIVIATSKIEHSDNSSVGIADLTSCYSLNQYVHAGQYIKIKYLNNDTYRTITQDELDAFRNALEACYVQSK